MCLGLAAWLAAAVFSASAVEGADVPPPAQDATATEASVIVKYRADASIMRPLSAGAPAGSTGAAGAPEVPPQHAQVFAQRLGLALADGAPTGPGAQVIRATGITSEALAAQLSAQSDVEYAVVDRRVRALAVPNDTLFTAGQATTPTTGQWYLRKPGSDGEVASINAESAWDVTTGVSSVVVAVIDTGITSHPDLVGKVLPGYDFISNATMANDGDGRDGDPTDSGDGVTSSQLGALNGCTASDVHTNSWHGTQMAGLIGAATNNGAGMAGVGWNVMLLPLRALGRCGGSESDVVAAINWAAGLSVSGLPANPNKARVINLSLGGKSGVACDAAYQEAVTAAVNAGVVVVAAAGNDGLGLGAPANCTGVVAVAGVRHIGTKVGYSDLGPGITVAAPAGNCVNATGTCLYPLLTTSNGGAYAVGTPNYTDGDTHPSLGTSFATPLVAGTAALMISAKPSLTPAQVSAAISATARPFPTSGAPMIQRTANGPFVPVAACTAPSSVAQNYDCYCTTGTCGAGLLDAGAAVAAVAVTTVSVSASAATVTAGGSVTFDGTASTASGLRTIVAYQWAITSGAGLATFSGATNQPTATVATNAAGTVSVTLTVTDSAGSTTSASSSVTVDPAPVMAASSGGGGALSFGWLAGLTSAVAVLHALRRRRRL